MFWGPFFEGRDKILLLGKALKFGVIFLKFAVINKNMDNSGENLEKMQRFLRKITFFARAVGKNKNYFIPWLYCRSGAEPPVREKI